MKFYVYIIGTTNPKPRTYVGWTNNIDKRISAHNASKGAKYTRGSKWKLLYKEIFESKSDAMKREIFLKKDRKLRTQLRIISTSEAYIKFSTPFSFFFDVCLPVTTT